MSKYPEHKKIEKKREKAQVIGDFLDWLENDEKIPLCIYNYECSNTERLLAKYFKVNLKKLEKEKQEMIKQIKE